MTDLKGAHESLIDTHHGTGVVELTAVVRCREQSHQLALGKELIAVFNHLSDSHTDHTQYPHVKPGCLQIQPNQFPRDIQDTHTRLTALFPGLPGWKGKTNLDFTGARDSGWQWHQLGHMQVCTSLQTDNHASNSPLSFLQAGCPSCRPTNSVKALKA